MKPRYPEHFWRRMTDLANARIGPLAVQHMEGGYSETTRQQLRRAGKLASYCTRRYWQAFYTARGV